jgi:hypothetical protein
MLLPLKYIPRVAASQVDCRSDADPLDRSRPQIIFILAPISPQLTTDMELNANTGEAARLAES